MEQDVGDGECDGALAVEDDEQRVLESDRAMMGEERMRPAA